MENKHYINIDIVKKLMAEKEIDIKTMAILMEVTPPTVKRFLNGADQRHMPAMIIIKVSKALGVPAVAILY